LGINQNKIGDNNHLQPKVQEVLGHIFDIQRFSVNDGPGIRTTVFFKGCPLRCLWCDNPESQSEQPQVLYFSSLCTQCGNCVKTCTNGANKLDANGAIYFNHSLCRHSGRCIDACPSGARVLSGKTMSLSEVLEIVRKDELFYRNSGGGVTASGGEPSLQAAFIKKLFQACKEYGIHTTLDTSGYVSWSILKKILEYVDLVYYDLKHMNPEIHRELTGVNNELILSNVLRISQSNIPMVIRLPMIPGYNDSIDNIRETASFVARLKIQRADILPFHTLGRKKYDCLGITYRLGDLKPYTEDEVAKIVRSFSRHGLEVSTA
jgi:glycyl-radical enzyme activating protein